MRTRLKAFYAAASANHRAALALWFLRRGDLESASEAVPARNAAQITAAFVVRAEVLEALGRWDELLAMSESGSSAPSSLQLAARAHASRRLGRARQSQTALQEALRASVREGTLLQVIGMCDAMGSPEIVDAGLLELCTAPGRADGAFRLARDRFERSGQFELLLEALRKTSAAAANSPSVADYRRFELLLADRDVDPQETAAAVAEEPAATERRITHALALLKAGGAQDVLAVFDDFNVVVASLSPPQRAVAVAIIAANGHPDVAAELAREKSAVYTAPGAVALLPSGYRQAIRRPLPRGSGLSD
ncbi:MAG: hypothetical protein RIQ71_1709 [Verrucomicrobiota bacterium]